MKKDTVMKIKFVLVLLVIVCVAACERNQRQIGGAETTTATSALFTDKLSPSKAEGLTYVAAVMPSKTVEVLDGATLYQQTCAACHQATGQGIPAAFPPLDNSPYVTSDNVERLASIMVYGLQGPITVNGQTYTSVMAPLGAQRNDEELALIATYIRSSWSNSASAIDASVFAQVREKYGTRGMFTIEELGGNES
jgi:mono/diheme cytochrome c family protein